MTAVLGWDVGGVNTKVARVVRGTVAAARAEPYEIQRDPTALGSLLARLAAEQRAAGAAHAVTMTAELSQFFRTKREGVRFVLDAVTAAFPEADVRVYAADGRFLSVAAARIEPLAVAAANWAATAQLVARSFPEAILIDTGTTTTDIIPIAGGRVAARRHLRRRGAARRGRDRRDRALARRRAGRSGERGDRTRGPPSPARRVRRGDGARRLHRGGGGAARRAARHASRGAPRPRGPACARRRPGAPARRPARTPPRASVTPRKQLGGVHTVVKIGGGMLSHTGVFDRVTAAMGESARGRRLVIVPGGGPFADAVRQMFTRFKIGEEAAHWMAILGMDQYAHALAARISGAALVEGEKEIAAALTAGRIPVLAPFRWLKTADPLPHAWEVTSDSIAAWLAGARGAPPPAEEAGARPPRERHARGRGPTRQRREQPRPLHGGHPGAHHLGGPEREQRRVLVGGVEQDTRCTGRGCHLEYDRWRGASGPAPVGVGHQHHVRARTRGRRPKRGDPPGTHARGRQDVPEAHLDVSGAELRRDAGASREHGRAARVPERGAERAARCRADGAQGRLGHGDQRPAVGILGVDHIGAAQPRGTRFPRVGDAHEQLH